MGYARFLLPVFLAAGFLVLQIPCNVINIFCQRQAMVIDRTRVNGTTGKKEDSLI